VFLTVLLRNNNSSDKLGSEYLMVDVSVRFVGFILVGGGVGGIMLCRKVSWEWIRGVTRVLRWGHGVSCAEKS
jgi:hypothetical protein